MFRYRFVPSVQTSENFRFRVLERRKGSRWSPREIINPASLALICAFISYMYKNYQSVNKGIKHNCVNMESYV